MTLEKPPVVRAQALIDDIKTHLARPGGIVELMPDNHPFFLPRWMRIRSVQITHPGRSNIRYQFVGGQSAEFSTNLDPSQNRYALQFRTER